MSKTILTSTLVSGSITSTGSFGDIRLVNPTGHSKILSNDSLVLGAKSVVSVNIDYDGNQTDRAFIVRNNTDLATGGTELFRVNEDGNSIFAGDVSSSVASTASFGALRIESEEDGTTITTDRFGLTIDGQVGWYPLTVQSPFETAARFKSTDGTAAISIGDNSSTDNYNRIQVVGDGRMEFFVNNQEIIKLAPGGSATVFNEDSLDINFRFEGADDENLFYLDAGKNHATIGAARGNTGDEKLLVAGDVGVTGSLHVSGNISTSGSIIAKEFRTEFVNQIIATSSGSTTFGDDTGDVHRFTGSLNISASADTPAIQIGTGNIVRTGIKISDNRAQFGYDGGYAVVQGGGSKGVKLEVNNDTFGSGTEAMIVNASANVGIGSTEGNIAARLEVQQSAGTPIVQLRPSDASSALNPLIQYRSQLEGSANYFMTKGTDTYFATFDGAVPSDESKMIKISPNGTLSPTFAVGDDGSAVATLKVGGDATGVFIIGGATGSSAGGSMVSSSRLGSGSFGHIIVDGSTVSARNLEVTGSAGFTHGLRLGRSSSNNRGLIVLEKNNNTDDTGLAWLNTGGSYSATMYVSKSAGDFVFANTGVSGDLTTQNPNFVISSSGDVRMKSGAKLLLDNADAEGHTYISETSADELKIFVGGQEMMKFTEGADDRVEIGSTSHLKIQDGKALILGGSDDVVISHNTSTGGIIDNHTGDLIIQNDATDKDIIFKSDDGSDGMTSYLTIDGSSRNINVDIASYMDIKSADGSEGGITLSKSATDATHTKYSISHRDDNQSLIIYSYDGTTYRNWFTADEPNAQLKLGANSSNPLIIDDNGDLNVLHLIEHQGDTDTYVQFTNDRLRFGVGGEVLLDLFEGTQDYVLLGDGGDVDINLNGDMFVRGSDGNVGIGTDAPTSLLHIFNGDGSITDDANNHLLVEDDGHSYIGIGGGTSSDVGLHFMDSGGIRGRVAYHHADDSMTFKTANTVQWTMDSSGNVAQTGDMSGSITSTGSFGALQIADRGSSFTLGNHASKARMTYGGAFFQFTDADNSYSSIAVDSGSFNGDVFIRPTKKLYLDAGGSGPYTAGHTYITEEGADNIGIYAGGTRLLQLVEGGTNYVATGDNTLLGVGNDVDLFMRHNGTNSHIINSVGELHISQSAQDKDIKFSINDGGNIETPMRIEGSTGAIHIGQPTRFQFANDQRIYDDNGGGLAVGAEAHKLTLYGGSSTSKIEFLTGGRSGTKRVQIDDYGMQISGSTTSGRGVLDIEVQNGTYTDMDTAVRITNTHAEAEAGLALNTTGDALSSGITHNLTYDDNNPRQPNSGRTSGFITFVGNATSGVTSRIALGGAPEGGNVTSAYMPDRLVLDFDGNTKVVSGSLIVSESIGIKTGSPSADLEVNGTSNFTGVMYIDHGGSDYSPNISFMGGSNIPGSNTYENAGIGYYDNSGTGTMRFFGNRGAMNWEFRDDGDSLFLMQSDGDFHANGDVIAASTTTSSDIRLKKNVNDISYGLSEVLQLRGVEFDWKEKRDGKHDIGVIAQEIEKIIPEVVQESKDLNSDTMYKSVDYGKLTAVLVEAVKEQQVQIEELKEDIKELKK